MDDGLGCIVAIIILALAAVVGIGIYEDVHQARTARECLALGYREGDWRWFGPAYCIRRTDQTDVVVTLPEARAKGRIVP